MIYVMSDIHGNSTRFNSIMKQIALKESDHLYILGDISDRYADGMKILWKLMKLHNVTVLMGNHELMMLDALKEEQNSSKDICKRRWFNNGGYVTLKSFRCYNKPYRDRIVAYLNSLPYNIDINVNGKDFLLVHGSPLETYDPLNPKYDNPEWHAVWSRISPCDAMPAGKTVIFGHTPTYRYHPAEPMKIWHGTSMIGIDCGCGFEDGRLACLRLDDMHEFYSEQ